MTTRTLRPVLLEPTRTKPISDGVLGMLIFILTEVMLFAGLISAFSIIKAAAPLWPPPGQPRLPIEQTAVNTVALLLSGVMLIVAQRRFAINRRQARLPLLLAMLLGAFFVLFQGFEWVGLIRQGLTLTSSALGSFFYLIVGIHALHAVVAIALLVRVWSKLERGFLASSQLATTAVFWYFVVGVWPVLYGVVYL